jgi:predicted dehydrogenase
VKQIIQSLYDGRTELADVPIPAVGPTGLLIQTSASLISAGTERMLVDFGKAGWVEKARQQPDKVRQVLDKMRTDGIAPTIEAVMSKLDRPLPLGYCNVGAVVEVGPRATGFLKGDRVISNGSHAEFVSVPANLCAKVPSNVSDEEAAFTVLTAIALQGIRLTSPTLGETIAVMGLGLIGLLTVQLLRANGCRVIGIDMDSDRLAFAASFGAHCIDLRGCSDPVASASEYARYRGVDAVIITASTNSNQPIQQAAQMCRKRGRIVLVGVTGLELSRADFYAKELSFQVSCSYGPGRYDPSYEENGVDYPVGFVRWTEQRNFEAALDMMSAGRIEVRPLISHRFPIVDACDAYALIGDNAPSLGILLEYRNGGSAAKCLTEEQTVLLRPGSAGSAKQIRGRRIAFIGAGNYANGMLMPAFRRAGAVCEIVASQNGVTSVAAGRKHGFRQATTDLNRIFDNPELDAVVIATRHDTHASLTVRAIDAGKHVFVEKPLAMNRQEIQQITDAIQRAAVRGPPPILTVGFNRRFSPHVVRMKTLLSRALGAKSFIMTVNAGVVPAEHWTQDAERGGGRIVGEACHFIDLLRYLSGCPIEKSRIDFMGTKSQARDSAVITLCFSDGSTGTVHYLANGSRAFPKERLEVFSTGGVLQLDNFRRLQGYGWPGFTSMRLWRQDKGQQACAASFLNAIASGNAPPIPLEEIIEVASVTVDLASDTT